MRLALFCFPTPALVRAARRACKTCIETRHGQHADSRPDGRDGRTGALCPTCNQTMSLTGVCDNCA